MTSAVHSENGNCWSVAYKCEECGIGVLCDVCHEHDEVRGDCDECVPCAACDVDELEREQEQV